MLSKSYICNLTQEERDVLVAKVDKLFAESSDAELGRTWIEKDLGVWEYVGPLPTPRLVQLLLTCPRLARPRLLAALPNRYAHSPTHTDRIH